MTEHYTKDKAVALAHYKSSMQPVATLDHPNPTLPKWIALYDVEHAQSLGLPEPLMGQGQAWIVQAQMYACQKDTDDTRMDRVFYHSECAWCRARLLEDLQAGPAIVMTHAATYRILGRG